MNKIDRVFRVLVTTLATALVIVAIYNLCVWDDSIHNPINEEYVIEVAFNEGIEVCQVTQRMFNDRYGR